MGKNNKNKTIKNDKVVDKNKVILSIKNASYQYSDATSDEYAIK